MKKYIFGKEKKHHHQAKQVKFLFIDFLQNISLDVWKFDFSLSRVVSEKNNEKAKERKYKNIYKKKLINKTRKSVDIDWVKNKETKKKNHNWRSQTKKIAKHKSFTKIYVKMRFLCKWFYKEIKLNNSVEFNLIKKRLLLWAKKQEKNLL